MRSIYFDYNATTPLDPQVRAAMLPFLDEVWGNPSSVHHVGRRARALLDDARDRCAAVLGCKGSEVVFTSGGTEADNMALRGAVLARAASGRRGLVVSAIEHEAVLNTAKALQQPGPFFGTDARDLFQLTAADSHLGPLRPHPCDCKPMRLIANLGHQHQGGGVFTQIDFFAPVGKNQLFQANPTALALFDADDA